MIEQETGTPPAAEPLTSTTPYLSGHTRATVTIILLLAVAAISLLGVVSSLLQLGLLQEALGGGVIPRERAEANDLREGLVGVLHVSAMLGTAVAFCFWVHRAYRNLHALGNPHRALDYSPGWAVGYFFIPILHLFMPYRVVKEIWEKSDPAVRTADDLMYAVSSSTPLVLAWWITWLVSGFVGRVSGRGHGEASTAETLIWVTQVDILSAVLWIVAAVLAVLVVRGIDRRQEARSRHVVYVPETPPPPPLFTQPTPPGARP